ncbi:MAG: putative hydrolase of the superfamily [Thermoleophilaceae bacterium]|jgi:putative hydrolase of the HAD superfamily|nr:putative hydrolase of the superfamily [Thermoleophilaceae bacterium]MEA2352942.1 putative hydrolase of the superfamily [Thermoleophilaceae bacterium]
MIRAVISDFGGVLTSPLIESFMAYQDESGVRFEDLGRAMARAAEKSGEHPLFELEKGTITEAEFLAMLEAELDGDVHLGSLRETYFAHLKPNEPMISFMRELRERGLRMALLTNNVREWEPHWRAKLPDIDEIFEVIVDSAFVGMRKPDPAIYELTLERLGDGLSAEECVFVDDNDVNVEAARALGMVGVQFRDSAQARAEVETALNGGQ